MEGGYCLASKYEERLQEKGAQHKALEEALKDHSYNVTILPLIIRQSGSQYHTTSDALAKIGMEHACQNHMDLQANYVQIASTSCFDLS